MTVAPVMQIPCHCGATFGIAGVIGLKNSGFHRIFPLGTELAFPLTRI
jgi:hypothetical protein